VENSPLSFADKLRMIKKKSDAEFQPKKKPASSVHSTKFYIQDLIGSFDPAGLEDLQNPDCEIFIRDGGEYKLFTGERPAAETRPVAIVGDYTQEVNQMVDELNGSHFVSWEGCKTFVYREEYNDILKRHELHRMSFMDFQNYYSNKYICIGEKAGEKVYKPLGEVWIKHPMRRQYTGITMEPCKESTEGKYNLWRGFSVEPVAGVWKLMRDHIFHIICSQDDNAYQYVMGWLALTIQKPGQQGEVALVMRGKRGTGKGMLGTYMCRLFGGNSIQIFSSKYLTGNFNAHLLGVVFLFADEAFWAGDHAGENTLKGLITETSLTLEGKGRDAVFARNMLHILMASNNDWVVPAGLEERRYCVLDVCDSKMQNKAYFSALVDEMENGGLAAMLYDLQNFDLSGFDVREVPQTSGLFEQKLQSMDSFTEWWFHRLTEGELMPGEGWEDVPTEKLYSAYLESLARRAINYRSGQTQFGISLKKMVPKGWELRKYRYPESGGIKQVYHYRFPELEKCRKHFESLIKCTVEW
jgi:hypothetical protein